MDLLTLLATAKGAGFEAGHIISMAVMYYLLRRDLKKAFFKEIAAMVTEQFGKLIEAIKHHENTTNSRFEEIENHIGLKRKPKEGKDV